MKTFKALLERVEQNQQTIAQHGTFDEAMLKKINYKLRLDWNYYSNRIEGGTLTKAETRSVMINNIDVQGKPLRDIMEMSGHDKVVIDVLKMSKGELTLAERRIKEIHSAIMHEDDPKKQNLVGAWKQEDNEIINYKGEKIAFTTFREVPDAVHKLLDKTNALLEQRKGKSTLNAIEIAAQFHIDFITIHPFYDGNGRTTRILTNIILMACGYPAIIVKDQHKQNYFRLLADIQAYGGSPDLFYAFLAERVLDTQQLVLDALEGKDIDEEDDLDKLIHQAKLELAQKTDFIEQGISKKKAELLLGSAIKESFGYALEKTQPFHAEFIDVIKRFQLWINGFSVVDTRGDRFEIIFTKMLERLNTEHMEIGSMTVELNIFMGRLRKNKEGKNAFIKINFSLTDLIGRLEMKTPSDTVQHTFYYNEENGGITFAELKKHLDTALTALIKHILSLANE